MSINPGFVAMDYLVDIVSPNDPFSSEAPKQAKTLVSRLGIKAVRCGAPTKGGYGYPERSAAALKLLMEQRPAHFMPLAWVAHLLSKPQEDLRKMAGVCDA